MRRTYFVEHLEGSEELLVCEKLLLAHGGDDELGVVDEPVQVLVVRGQDRVDQVHQLVVLSKVRAPKNFQL